MAARAKKLERGQATIEMALTLPFLIWLIYYTLNSFFSIHTAHIGQRYAAMNVYERLNNRAQFVVDDVARTQTAKNFIAVQYTDTEGKAPQRKIILGPIDIKTVVGVCREPRCD